VELICKDLNIVAMQSLEVMKTYQSTVPVNSAALSPIFDHVSGGFTSVVRLFCSSACS